MSIFGSASLQIPFRCLSSPGILIWHHRHHNILISLFIMVAKKRKSAIINRYFSFCDAEEHMHARRNSLPLFGLICMLLLGMCFGNIPADSFFECVNPDFFHLQSNFRDASIRSGSKAAPLAQIYENRTFTQYEAMLSLRHTPGRSSVRTGRGFGMLLCALLLFSLSLLYLASQYPRELFQEAPSNTVIISYIHRQDGQKPSLL